MGCESLSTIRPHSALNYICRETKTVNSWFQNKRASAQKKANRVASHSDKRASTVSANQDDSDDYDPDYAPSSDPSKSKARNRLSNEQLEALRQSFILNDMPTPAERESLANQLNLSVQSVTNWFQNQRSIVKKTPDDIDVPDVPRQYSAYPPPSSHPSLPSLPPASTHPSIPSAPPLYTRPTSASPESSSRAALRRSTTPYTASSTASGGRRRSRPEPHQLAALHSLYRKSSNPSIHDRNILAAESGMYVFVVPDCIDNCADCPPGMLRRYPTGLETCARMTNVGDPVSQMLKLKETATATLNKLTHYRRTPRPRPPTTAMMSAISTILQ